jgi:5-formyltetrahydrofolate cyclo-ligase
VNKHKLRSKILYLRKKKSNKNFEINLNIFSSFLKNKNYIFKNVGGYFPSNYEIDDLKILKFLEKKNFNILLPVIKKNNQMDFFKWSVNDPLKINKFGIPEPIGRKIFIPDILLIPLVSYDRKLNRLGYGGGFYDRYIEKIEKHKKIIKIGLAFSYQKTKKIPINKFDKKLDFIINEKEILK